MLKSQNKTKKVIKVATFIILLCMMLDGCAKLEKKQKLPIATYMGGNNTITEICKELNAVGASHVDVFQEWVTDFADSAGKNANIKDTWSDPEKMKVDTDKCMDGWEKKSQLFRHRLQNDSLSSARWTASRRINRR